MKATRANRFSKLAWFKMAILSKQINRLNAIPIKIPTECFVLRDKLILNTFQDTQVPMFLITDDNYNKQNSVIHDMYI